MDDVEEAIREIIMSWGQDVAGWVRLLSTGADGIIQLRIARLSFQADAWPDDWETWDEE